MTIKPITRYIQATPSGYSLHTEPNIHEENKTARPNSENTDKANIVHLLDSNGNPVEEKKLFPKHNAAKLWCPTTQETEELFNKTQPGSRRDPHRNKWPDESVRYSGWFTERSKTRPATHFHQPRLWYLPCCPGKKDQCWSLQGLCTMAKCSCPSPHSEHWLPFDRVCLYQEVVLAFPKTLKHAALIWKTSRQTHNNTAHTNTPRPVRCTSALPDRASRSPSKDPAFHLTLSTAIRNENFTRTLDQLDFHCLLQLDFC